MEPIIIKKGGYMPTAAPENSTPPGQRPLQSNPKPQDKENNDTVIAAAPEEVKWKRTLITVLLVGLYLTIWHYRFPFRAWIDSLVAP